jgi:diguanylate cyclase (GGDEF)-like protein
MTASVAIAPREKRQPPFLARIALPAIAMVVMLAIVLTAVVFLAASNANQLAAERQENLAKTVLQQRIDRVAHDQEAVTIWDDAVKRVRAPNPDFQWIDDNLGVWLHAYYGHDAAFIVSDSDRPIYAMRDGRRATPAPFDREVWAVVAPLIAELRAKLRKPSAHNIAAPTRSAGAVDLAMVSGHPAIVSVKPIITDSGKLAQVPGAEFLHISIRRLDGGFPAALAQEYHLDGARFVRTLEIRGDERAAPLTNSSGETLGYLAWQPFGPGALMIQRIAPFAIGAVFLILAMVGWLLQRIRHSTLALQASQAQAQHLAFHDSLTGLANRALFDERLTRALAEAKRSGRSIALHYLDLDRFKHVNDTLGHPVGDELIETMARRLVEATRATDVVARIGGDEFAIIQTNVDTPAEAEVLCLRIVEALNEPFQLAGNQIHVGVSIGVALAPTHAGDRTELARKADIALYEAKAAGRGRFVFFADDMDATIRHRREIERDLHMAIQAGDQFAMVYQPLFSAQTGRMHGAEALLRWHHPTRGILSPAAFVPIAESTGLIEPIGEWALERACTDAMLLGLPCISVNLSAVQLRNEKLADRVFAILARTGLEPSRLELEITETSFIESAQTCQPSLSALRARGVQIALDDFGTGYSSFSHLRHFDVDRIKIDQSFVNGIDMREGGSAIIRAIIELAKASGMQVTAEGVETEEQSLFLANAGCNSLQGYLLSRPLAIERLAELVEHAGETRQMKRRARSG